LYNKQFDFKFSNVHLLHTTGSFLFALPPPPSNPNQKWTRLSLIAKLELEELQTKEWDCKL
jgi:hypothetical protein